MTQDQKKLPNKLPHDDWPCHLAIINKPFDILIKTDGQRLARTFTSAAYHLLHNEAYVL